MINKLLFKLILVVAIVPFFSSFGFSQYADCVPNPSVTDPEGVGIRHPIKLPIAFIGEHYSTVLTIIAPEKATTWGFLDITITKIQLTEMRNMPQGLNCETNSENEDDFMYAGEKYCMTVEGTPSGQAGLREIEVYANAWIRMIFETSAPGNPRHGGNVSFTLCNRLNLNLGNDLNITTSEQVLISADQGNNFHSYLWHDNSSNPSFLARGSQLGVGRHKIKVTVTDTVGTTGVFTGRSPDCYKSDSIYINITQANNINLSKNSNFTISPNPSSGACKITFNDSHEPIHIYIYDLSGILVYRDLLKNEETEIDLSFLKNGVYSFVIKTTEGFKTSKLMIIH